MKRKKAPRTFRELTYAEQVDHARYMVKHYQNGPDRHTSGGQQIVRQWLDWLKDHNEKPLDIVRS